MKDDCRVAAFGLCLLHITLLGCYSQAILVHSPKKHQVPVAELSQFVFLLRKSDLSLFSFFALCFYNFILGLHAFSNIY